MEKKIEELKSMTQDELVVLVQNLQEDLDKKAKDSSFWYGEFNKVKEKYTHLKNIIKGVVAIIE